MKFFEPLGPSDFKTITNPGHFKPQTEQMESNKKGFSNYVDSTKEEH